MRDALVAVGEGRRDLWITTSGSDELAELAAAANVMIGRLDREERARDAAEEARRGLVAAVSHDLRTPITSLRLLADAVSDELVDGETRAEYLRRMSTHLGALSALIDDLFELSRIEAGDIRWGMEQVRLDGLVEETVGAMRAQGDARGVHVVADVPDLLVAPRANPEKLQRVLFNLIQNAIRHTPSDGSVTVRGRAVAQGVEVEVADTGEGIAAEDRGHVFDALYRGGTQASRSDDGAGLGLAISRAIVEAHGGRIWLAERPRGTCVRFSLPAESRAEPMVLLVLFAFIAGAATALSPCVLPVLPIALAAGVTGGRRRPLGVVTGLALSFTFAIIALVYVISALGLPDDLLRTFAIAVLLVFGLSLLVPPAAARIEAWLSRFATRAPAVTGDGFGSGLLVGAGLGFVYAPCAGPILAGVITVSASQPFTGGRLVVALAYGLGSAVVLYALMLGGRRVTSRLARRSTAFQAAMGAVMVLVAVAMFANLDTRFETKIATGLPGVPRQPDELAGEDVGRAAGARQRPRDGAAAPASRRSSRPRAAGPRHPRRRTPRSSPSSGRRRTSRATSAGSTRRATGR